MTKTYYAASSVTKRKKKVTLNPFISCKYVFIVVNDFGAKKNHLKPFTSGSIFPTPPTQRSNSPLPGH